MIRKIIRIDEDKCTGCGLCVPNCAEGAIRIIDGKARIVADKYCDGLGACLGHCPEDALTIIEREADAFDEEAVAELLAEQAESREPAQALSGRQDPALAGQSHRELTSTPPRELAGQGHGCPSARSMSFQPAAAPGKGRTGPVPSQLGHWPVQLRLVNPESPFLKNAHLLLTADCVPVSLPDFHQRHVPGKVVLLGCPKFDDAEDYVQRLTAIFRSNAVKAVTVLRMEVPCCAGLSSIVVKALKRSGRDVPVETLIIGRTGEEVREQGPGAVPLFA